MSRTMVRIKTGGDRDVLPTVVRLLEELKGVSNVTPRQADLLLVDFQSNLLAPPTLLNAITAAGYQGNVVDL
ncbi:hypothetical protein [Candidatus Thiosymbion oneisti]|uniref:hypothetical protein n=1 Tax=Candidatus Thiosymbion oneisti TaxID=589554 RepID=UPI001060241A|nr:hypothetical protein [Candidatus Thiosymbion oneisti]